MAHVQDRRYREDAQGNRHRTAYTGEKPYRVRYRGPDGTEHSESFALKRDATRFASGVDTDQARGNWVDPRLGRITMADWVEMVDQGLTGYRPSTRARDESYVKNHILPAFGALPLAAIDHMLIQRWIADLAKKYAPSTVHKAEQLLNRYLKEAVRAGRLASNPAAEVRLPKIVKKEMRFLDPTEVARLTDSIDQRYRGFVTLGAFSGLRVGEMFGLRVKNVDVLRRQINVVEQLQEVSGHLMFGPPKTPTSVRRVPVPSIVIDEITPHLVNRPADATVFLAPEGGLVRLNQFRRRQWNPAVAAAGLGEKCVIHSLRHTAISLWIASGATHLEVAKRAGHSSVAVVYDRYGHLYPDAESKLNDRLEELARQGQQAAAGYGQVVPFDR